MIDTALLQKMHISTNGKKRVLYTYRSDKIKKQHKAYLSFMNEYFLPSRFSHAYTKKRSIYTNAIVHLNNDIFIKMDVKDFFPSLNHRFLTNELHYELNKKHKEAITYQECKNIVENSSIGRRGLPLGLIPSPMLSNIYMKRFDSIFYGKLKRLDKEVISNSFLYTRYADDIFISFKSPAVGLELESIRNAIVALCEQELRRCYLKLNTSKTRMVDLRVSNHFKIAGINIAATGNGSRRLTVGRRVIKNLYYDALNLQSRLESKANNDQLSLEVQQVKGMHSFLYSVEKEGYSHVLSDNMQNQIISLGYESLEQMIGAMNVRSESVDQL